MGMGRLVEQGTGQVFSMGFESVSIGRYRDNTLVLRDPLVSRHHAEIAMQGGRWVIRDLGSANGTFVNGRRIAGLQVLNHGDTIQVGRTRFQMQTPEALAAQDTLVERLRPEEVLGSRPRRFWLVLALGLAVPAAVIVILVGVLMIRPRLQGDGEVTQNAGGLQSTPVVVTTAAAEPSALPADTQLPSILTETVIPTIPLLSPEPTTLQPTVAPPSATDTPAAPPLIGYFRADRMAVETGQCARLEWGQVENANSVTLGGVGRVKFPGKLDVCLDSTKSYTLKVTGPGGTVEESIQITVQPATGSIIEYFRVVPSIISPGDCAQLEWGKVKFATSATIEPGIGGVGTPGSRQVCPGGTTTYVLTAHNPEGTTAAHITLIVSSEPGQKPVIQFFTANPGSIQAGECTTLSWGRVDYAASVTIDHGIGGVATPGSKEVCLGTTTTYVMTAEGSNGMTEHSLTVAVSAGQLANLPDLVIESIFFEPNPCYRGQKCKVRVKVRNDGSVGAGHFVLRWAPAGTESVPVEWDLDSLDAGQEKELKYTWIPARIEADWRTLATVDAYDEVEEIKEATANTLEQFITVLER